MKNLNLKKRILLGYLPPLLLMLVVCAAVVWSARSVIEISRSVERAYNIVSNIKDVQIASAQMVQSARGYILARNDTSRRHYSEAQARIRSRIQLLGTQILDTKQQENLGRIAAISERLAAVTEKELKLVDAGEVVKAVQVFATGESVEFARQFAEIIDAFERRESEIVAARQLAQNRDIDSLVSQVLALTAIALVLAFALGWWIAVRISQTLVEAVANMTTSSTEIAATVDEHERVVTQQAAAVNETTTTIEELSASSLQSSTQAESATAAAKGALVMTQDGIRLANEVSVSMGAMKQKVGSVAEQILRLSEQAGQIGGIAKVVGELAGETNMLALNAAVEAARAGEHGKGFAVVAVEVRKLADQSKKSAERAYALVAEIQKATNTAVMIIEEGGRTTEEVAAIVGRTIDAFSSISDASSSVSISAQQVLLNSKQQAAALAQVTEAMKSLSAGAAQMSAGTEQTKNGVRKLNTVALGLQAMV